jgi:hypothetical protein
MYARIRLSPNSRLVGILCFGGFILLNSCATAPAATGNFPWCSLAHRSPDGATEIPPAQIFMIDYPRLPEAFSLLRQRTLISLSDREAASYVSGWRAVPGRKAYLVRAGVATGVPLPLAVYYRTAQGTYYFGMWHPRDRHLEVVASQIARDPFVFNDIPAIVQTELAVDSAAAVCHTLSEGKRDE